jgi:hypothetical protein
MERDLGPLEEEVIRALDKYTLDDPNAWDAKLFEAGGEPGHEPTERELIHTLMNYIMGQRAAIVLLARHLDELEAGQGRNLPTDPPSDDT